MAACRAMLRGGSRSFHAASLLLPRRIYEPAAALYAFCRLADDAIDLDGGSVASLRQRLHRAYAGQPLPIAADRAFAAVVARYAIPRALPEALLEGFEWDAAARRYDDLEALLGYAARVAGSVGAMMAVLMGAREAAVVARACDLGMAMQLTNIARDVGEDARNGRLYLPLEWLREAGIEADAWLARPVFTPAVGGVVRRLLGEAEALYTRADAGIACLPPICRPGIGAARWIYAEIGRELERKGNDSINARATVSGRRKLVLLVRSLLPAKVPSPAESHPVADAARFLVESVTPLPSSRDISAGMSRKTLDERAAWLVDLFARLGDRRQLET